MKKWVYILASTLFLGACETEIVEKNSYLIINNEQEFTDYLTGIYSQLASLHDKDYFFAFVRSDDVTVYTNFQYSNSSGGCGHSWGPDRPNYENIKDEIYRKLYSIVVNLNYVLENYRGNGFEKYLGEIYFLRGYTYFKLVRLFGQCPLVTDCEVDYTLEKPTFQEIYDFIEADLKAAIDLLPDAYQDARVLYETPNKGTAKAYLAELYLNMGGYPIYNQGKYAEAAKVAKDVIENASKYNFSLEPDFANLWKEEYRHTSENIFGLHYKYTSSIGNNYLTGSGKEQEIYGNFKPQFSFYIDFPLNYRKINSLVVGYYTTDRYTTYDSIISERITDNYWDGHTNFLRKFNIIDPITNPCQYTTNNGVFYIKWLNAEPISTDEYGYIGYKPKTYTTLFLLRYAQTLLTYAEAKARSGDLDQSAFNAVNKVRRRAYHLDMDAPCQYDIQLGLTPEQFADSVVWERAWETCFEPDGRWFDIVRLDLKKELFQHRIKNDVFEIIKDKWLSDDWYFYKIPQDDRWINPNFN